MAKNLYKYRTASLSLLLLLLILSASPPLYGRRALYAEHYYRFYHTHLYNYSEDLLGAVYYLGMALRSNFANPLYAIAKIEDETEWEKYRYLFYMHVNLLLVKTHLQIADRYDKHRAYFYNAPWSDLNRESLALAQKYYHMALHFWEEALEWSEKASASQFRWITLSDVQYWEDENFRIQKGELNYAEIVEHHLMRVEKVLDQFSEMDETTY